MAIRTRPRASGAEQQDGSSLPATVVIDDVRPARVRRPLDLARFVVALVVVGFLVLVGMLATQTSRALNADVGHLLAHVPAVLVHTVSFLGATSALLLPVAFLIRDIARGRALRLIEGLLSGVLAIAIVRALNWLLSHYGEHTAFYTALTLPGQPRSVGPLDSYLAALLALLAVLGVAREPLWRGLASALGLLYTLSVFLAGHASLLSLVMAIGIGAAIGLGVQYAAGIRNERPDAIRVAKELAAAGLAVRRMHRVEPENVTQRVYLAWLARPSAPDGIADGPPDLLLHVLDRDLLASGAFYGLYRLARVRQGITPPPPLSLEHLSVRRALLARSATDLNAPTPRLIAALPCGADASVLAYEHHDVVPMPQPSDEQLGELWGAVEKMHHGRVTHRGLSGSALAMTHDGHVRLPVPEDGAAFASDLRITLDRAQLMMTTAHAVGAQRAIAAARTVLGVDALAATLPLMQPLTMPRETRLEIARRSPLYGQVRAAIQAETAQPEIELSNVERVRLRTIVMLAALIVAAYLLIGQLGSLDLATVFSRARFRWVTPLILASAGTYLAAALSLTGYVRERLSFLRTTLVQVASSFVGFVTPPAVGGLALNLRYLAKSGVSPTGAATSVGMSQIVNLLSHSALLVACAAATGASAHGERLPIPAWMFVVLGVLAAASLLALAVPLARRWVLARVLPPLREALPRLLEMVTTPLKLAQALAGTLLLNGFYILALWCAVRAFEGQVSIAAVAVVYLAGAAIASAAPTPGGLGAVEVALSTGLSAAGMPSAAAVSAVLLFRLATFWAPIPLGWAALHWLQRQHAV